MVSLSIEIHLKNNVEKTFTWFKVQLYISNDHRKISHLLVISKYDSAFENWIMFFPSFCYSPYFFFPQPLSYKSSLYNILHT